LKTGATLACFQSDGICPGICLNQQFASIFTEEDMDNLPELGISSTPEMNKITINTDGAQNLLQHLKPNKATGPDDIPAKFLKEKSFSLKWSNVCSFTLGRFDEVEEFFVVWSDFIFTEHGVNVVVICLSTFALHPYESEHPQPTICLCFHRRGHGQPPRPRY
jgi:hypothetical protein